MHGKDRDDDDDVDEWLRKERETMPLNDRPYGKPRHVTADGFIDGRSERRTGRVLLMPIRMSLLGKALFRTIKKREGIPSDAVLLEILMEAYMKDKPIREDEIPNLKQLVEQYEKEQDKRHAGKGKNL